jgi:hypothetical protein
LDLTNKKWDTLSYAFIHRNYPSPDFLKDSDKYYDAGRLLESALYNLLKQAFQNEYYYIDVIQQFHDVSKQICHSMWGPLTFFYKAGSYLSYLPTHTTKSNEIPQKHLFVVKVPRQVSIEYENIHQHVCLFFVLIYFAFYSRLVTGP